jgi:hypothetical protein
MNIFTEAFTYNGDGTFTITEDALREVFYKLHIAEAVEASRLVTYDDYYWALTKHESRAIDKVEDEAERDRLLRDLDGGDIKVLADYSVDKLKKKKGE